MKIYVKQIDEASLTAFVTGAAGATFSGQLNSYLANGGHLGNGVVYASGGAQIISGTKTFDASPLVPYSGGTGAVPSRLYVDNQIALSTLNASGNAVNLSGSIFATGSGLSSLRVTGSDNIQVPNLSGINGFSVIRSGSFVLFSQANNNGDGINLSGKLTATGQILLGIIESSGQQSWEAANNNGINLSGRLVASGAIVSAVKITGDFVQNPNFSGIGGTNVVRSGNFVLISGGGGGGSSTISVTGSSPIAAPNFSGMNGTLVIQSGSFVLISGGAGNSSTFNTFNTFNITGTGSVVNNLTSSGSMTNTFNDYSTNIFTGNLTNISFFFDPVPTGLNLVETFVSNNFTFSGARFSCRQSGTGPINGGILSGKLYQVDSNNTEQTLYNFTFTTGIIYSGSPLFSTNVTGNNRVGLSITNLISGISQFTVGVFGY